MEKNVNTVEQIIIDNTKEYFIDSDPDSPTTEFLFHALWEKQIEKLFDEYLDLKEKDKEYNYNTENLKNTKKS